MNKIIVRLYVPMLEVQYDVRLPINKKIYKIIMLLTKAINDINGGYYTPTNMPRIYDKITAQEYDINLTIKESTIRNGSEIILI